MSDSSRHKKWTLWVGLIWCGAAADARAATCTWNSAGPASWHVPSNWNGCTAGNGTPIGTPGPADRAVLPSAGGAALLDIATTTIAELDMAPGAELGVVETQTTTRQLTVTNAATLASATLSGALPPPGGPQPAYLSLQLAAGSTLSLSGSNRLRRASVTNAGTATFQGGTGVRLNLELNSLLNNSATGVITVSGDYVFGYAASDSISNLGNWINQGPGLVAIERSGSSGGQFVSSGQFEILDGSFRLLNPPAGFQASFVNSSLRLRNATFDNGATEAVLGAGRTLLGNGTLTGAFRASGTLDLQASDGGPYGVLNVLGSVQFNSAELVLDVGGPGAAQHDRFVIGGSARWQRVTPRVRLLGGYAPGIDTGIAIASHASVDLPNLPVHERVLSDYPLSFALKVAAVQTSLRVVPTLTLADTAVDEGDSGSQVMQMAVTLSAPTTETVGFGYTSAPGTAVTTPVSGNPADYGNALGNISFAPGEVSKQIPITINGDTLAEADEAFVVVTDDAGNTGTLQNASFGNNRRFSARAEGRIRDDDSAPDTRYLLIGKSINLPTATGQVSFVRRYTTTGVAVDGWATQMQNAFGNVATGFCRAPDGGVLSTRFSTSQGPVLMTPAGAVRDDAFGGLIGDDESCAFDQLGNAWVGEAVPESNDQAQLRYIAGDGRVLQTLQVPVGERGIDWIELDSDQCTIYYTSEDSDVRRFDVCAGQALEHFASGLEPPCYALRQLPDKDLMVTCTNRIYRYDAGGTFIREYTRQSLGETNTAGLYAVHLDPDGQTFWTGGVESGRVVRVDLDDGSVVTSFNTGSGGINGLLVEDEYVAGIPDRIFADDFEP